VLSGSHVPRSYHVPGFRVSFQERYHVPEKVVFRECYHGLESFSEIFIFSKNFRAKKVIIREVYHVPGLGCVPRMFSIFLGYN
jgi:hypothetical protein